MSAAREIWKTSSPRGDNRQATSTVARCSDNLRVWDSRESKSLAGTDLLTFSSGTPRDIVSAINAEVNRIAGTTEMRAQVVELGFQPVIMSVSETENFIRADVERWANVIREAGIKAD